MITNHSAMSCSTEYPLRSTKCTVSLIPSRRVSSIEMVTKYWIAKSDGLFRKEESNGSEAGMKIKTTKTYEYDPSIKIEAPIP